MKNFLPVHYHHVKISIIGFHLQVRNELQQYWSVLSTDQKVSSPRPVADLFSFSSSKNVVGSVFLQLWLLESNCP